jgi:outer membrane protein assembly complex protein YaeT
MARPRAAPGRVAPPAAVGLLLTPAALGRLLTPAALGLLLTLAAPLAAQEVSLQPVEGVPLDDVPGRAKVQKLEIVGADAISESVIKRRLYTEGPSGTFFFRKARRLNRDEFLNDLRRVVVVYQQSGYFDADVEGYRARVTTKGDVELAIFVSEGLPSVIDTLRIELATPSAPDSIELERARRGVPLKEGDVFNEARIDSTDAVLKGRFQNRGYAFAEVLKEYRIDKDTRRATVVFTVDADGLYRFGRLTIEGETDVSEKLIRSRVEFRPGRRYALDKVYDTQRRLYGLNLFRRVQVEPQYDAPVGDSLPVVIRLADAKQHLVRLGVGYGSEEQFRASVSWLDRNFLGGARQARVQGEYSGLRREALVSLTQPNVFNRDLSTTATGFFAQDREDTYVVQRIGGSARVNQEISPSVRAFYGFNIEYDDFTEIENLEDIQDILGQEFINPSTLSYLELGALLDTTDDLLSPTEGYTLTLNYHLAQTWFTGDYQYHRVTLLATHYRELKPGWILALKALPGVIEPIGQVTTPEGDAITAPLFERLFAGGSTSVRGYQRRMLGPLVGDDCDGNIDNCDPVGGEALLEASVELRFPLFGNLRGVTFVDAGDVWAEPKDVALSDLRYTPGLGVRYATPVGPVRVDVGFKTKSEDPGPPFVVHFSVGNAF